MYRPVVVFFLAIGLLTTACGSERAATAKEPLPDTSEHDRALLEKQCQEFDRQHRQDCPSAEQDAASLAAVQRAHSGDVKQNAHGPRDPYNRRPDPVEGWKTRPNPRGKGVIVTAWYDQQSGATADFSRRRSAWLVLDGTVYPLNQNAANNLGRLFDGVPESGSETSRVATHV
jgi:hypothetical protein